MFEPFYHAHCSPKKKPRVIHIIGMIVGGITVGVMLAFLFGYFVMLLWNWLMPVLFGVITITYWQAFGIVVLAKLLFGGFKGPRPPHHPTPFAHMRSRSSHSSDSHFSKWKYYEEFWKDEGKNAFDAYVDKKEEK